MEIESRRGLGSSRLLNVDSPTADRVRWRYRTRRREGRPGLCSTFAAGIAMTGVGALLTTEDFGLLC